jgi:hypothetical protein
LPRRYRYLSSNFFDYQSMPTKLQDHSSLVASTKAKERRRQIGTSWPMQRGIFNVFSIGLLGISSAPIFLIQRFAVGRGVTSLEGCHGAESVCRTLACRVFDWGEVRGTPLLLSEELQNHMLTLNRYSQTKTSYHAGRSNPPRPHFCSP